jgi:hypothetical protein
LCCAAQASQAKPQYGSKHEAKALLCAALPFCATTATYAQDSSAAVSTASAFAWTAENAAKLNAVFKDPNTVTAFYNQTLTPEDAADENPRVIGEYLIFDLNDDAQLELLCTADVSGRAFYTGLTVFSQQKGKIVRFDVSTNGANFEHPRSSLADLRLLSFAKTNFFLSRTLPRIFQ